VRSRRHMRHRFRRSSPINNIYAPDIGMFRVLTPLLRSALISDGRASSLVKDSLEGP
jgi:hypothetical protein